MIDIKYWRSEDESYNEQLKLGFGQCDKNKNMTIQELLRFTSDAAGDDFTERGLSWQWLQDRKVALLVSKNSFHVHKMVKFDDLVTLQTWEEAAQGVQAVRRYKICNQDGELLISGKSLWIVVNTETMRITKATDFTYRPLPTKKTELDCMDCGKIHFGENLVNLGERPIRFSDLDANGHVNNSRYGSFIVDVLPEKYQNKQWKDFRINYAHETYLGSTLTIFAEFDEANNRVVVIAKDEKETCFEAELIY